MKKVVRILMVVLVMLLMVMTVAGCSSVTDSNDTENASDTTVEEKESYVFAASYFTLNNTHFIEWQAGLTEVIEGNGDTLINLDAQLDLSKQIADIEDMLQRGDVDALFLAPVDSEGIRVALESCKEAGVPVIMMDIPTPEKDKELIAFEVTTDNYSAGYVLGEDMVKRTNGEAKVAIIDWDINQAVVDRVAGFKDAIKESSGIEIILQENAAASVESALPLMEDFLQQRDDITCVFGINDPSCFGAYSALEAAERTDIQLYSIDGSADGIQAVEDGVFVGTSAQFPRKMGVTAATLVYDYLSGKEVEKEVRIPSVFITQENISDYK